MTASVRRVRVYVDQCAVTWRLRAPATPDTATVRFTGLPASFEHETLRAEAWAVRGDARRPLDVVEVSTRNTAAPADDRRTAAQAELDRLDATLAELDDDEATERFGVARLERYAAAATRKVSVEWMDNDPPIERWIETFDLLRAQRQKWTQARLDRQVKRQQLQIEKADRLAELQALGEGSATATEVHVGLAGDLSPDEEWEVELTGLTPDAQWMPAYELRLSEAPVTKATLTAVALVRQSTGQDWSDVELVATTARPPLAEPPPPLRRLEVAGVPSDEDRTVISSHEEVARLTGTGTGTTPSRAIVEYTATATVAAHGRAVRVELFSVELPVTSQLEVAPGYRTTAVQTAIVDNTAGLILLPGHVSVFRAAHYAGQSQIGFIAAGERFVVPVGTDARVRVDRQVHRSPPRQTSLTGATVYDFSQTTMVENLSDDDVEVVVRDRTPISKSDGASVKLMERPAELAVDGEDGRTEVHLRLGAHGQRQLDVAYRITVPRGVAMEPPRDF